MQLQGKLKFIGDVKEFGSNGFTKRDIVIQTEEQYPQDLLLELHKDKCGLVDGIDVGTSILCSINIRGREWTSPQGEVRYFNTIVCWRIETTPLSGSDTPVAAPSEAFDPTPVTSGEGEDDLPF